MKIFFTNLAGFDERKSFMSKQLSSLGLNFEIIDCVDGRKWTKEDIKELISPRLFELYEEFGNVWLTKGAIAATKTHLDKIYQRMIEEDIDYALVLEDDVRLNQDFLKTFQNLEQWVESNHPSEIILLYAISKQQQILQKKTAVAILNNYKLYKPLEINMNFGGAYIINKKAAAALLASQQPIKRVADWWGEHTKANAIDGVYILYPFVCSTGEFESTLGYEKSFFSNFLQRIGFKKMITTLRKKFLSKNEKIELR